MYVNWEIDDPWNIGERFFRRSRRRIGVTAHPKTACIIIRFLEKVLIEVIYKLRMERVVATIANRVLITTLPISQVLILYFWTKSFTFFFFFYFSYPRLGKRKRVGIDLFREGPSLYPMTDRNHNRSVGESSVSDRSRWLFLRSWSHWSRLYWYDWK